MWQRQAKEWRLKGQHNWNGYLDVFVRVGGARKKYRAHRLVAAAFLPNPEGKKEVNHKNGNRKDNRVENLEWCTGRENRRHAAEAGLLKQKLTPAEALEKAARLQSEKEAHRLAKTSPGKRLCQHPKSTRGAPAGDANSAAREVLTKVPQQQDQAPPVEVSASSILGRIKSTLPTAPVVLPRGTPIKKP